MSKKRTESSLRPGISREIDKIKTGEPGGKKIKKDGWPKEQKILAQAQRARIKNVEWKILKDEKYNKHKKADKKIGGVRGKFHPSLDRTRKRT